MQNTESRQRVREKLKREAGAVILSALADDDVVEILLNPDGTLWIEKFGEGMKSVSRFEPQVAESFISTVASYNETSINRDSPILECEFPLDGSRFEALLPPIVQAPTFSIRKHASRAFALADYVGSGCMTEEQRQVIVKAILDKMNVLVVGGTGSGKTTLTNAMINTIAELAPDDRLIILEDTREIQCKALNSVQMRTSETKRMNHLLRATLRLRPDRIIVGEVRGGEALDLLKSWNTGHPGGVATLHANNARAGLVRLEQLIAEALEGGGAHKHMPKLIAEAVNLVVVISRAGGSRKITEIAEVHGFDGENYQLKMR
jgi:type IV secretion system protein VirB11